MLISTILTLPGVELRKFVPNSAADPIQYIYIDFTKNRKWFTFEECEILLFHGMYSYAGLAFEQDATKYNAACCGSNEIFYSYQDLIAFSRMARQTELWRRLQGNSKSICTTMPS